MALLDPKFILGVVVVLYLSSFVLLAILRILTGVSIQRIGYFSLRRAAYTLQDGLKIDVRGIGLTVHRPTFSQPTWLSIVVNELVVTVDLKALDGEGQKGYGMEEDDEESGDVDDPKVVASLQRQKQKKTLKSAARNPLPRRSTASANRSETWKKLTRVKERIKKLHRNIKWLRLVDVVATDSTVNVVDVGSIQCGSLTVAVDTRHKMVDRARFFFYTRAEKSRQKQPAEWIATVRSVLFTPYGGESSEIIDSAVFNVHGFLYAQLDGLRDATIALKFSRVHLPWDDVQASIKRYNSLKRLLERQPDLEKQYADEYATAESIAVDTIDSVIADDQPGKSDQYIMQAVSDSKEFFSSILRGIKEVQFAVSFAGLTKKIEGVRTSGNCVLLNASMKEVGIDMHRLDSNSPAHRMYFPSKDIAHEALAAALSVSVGLDDGRGKPERLVYIPMVTTTVRTTLPSKTVELADVGSAEERKANILFANSVVTSPSMDLDPTHIPILLALLRQSPQKSKATTDAKERHMLISRLLPKANIKFTMHEPVLRISLPPVDKTNDPDDFDLIISSISSISLDLESFHSAVQDLHYSLIAQMRVQTHHLYYQTTQGNRFDLLDTEYFDLKATLNANPEVHVSASGHLQSVAVRIVRPEITAGLRQIIHQLRLDVEPDKRGSPRTSRTRSGLRALPQWLSHFQISVDDFNAEIAGIDEDFPSYNRGVAILVESWSAEYRAQRLDPRRRHRPTSRRRTASRVIPPDPDLLSSPPSTTSRIKAPEAQNSGDGRKLSVQVRNLEVFVIESLESWEVDPFVQVPRFDINLSSLSDRHGPMLNTQTRVKTVRLSYSLYRHYAVLVALTVLKNSFVRTKKDVSADAAQPKANGEPSAEHLNPSSASHTLGPESPASIVDPTHRCTKDLITVDIRADCLQIKAEMPNDPPIMLQIFGLEASRHRWSPPSCQAKLIRLYAEAPRMRGVWARVVSVKMFRIDYRESRKISAGGAQQTDKLYDVVTDAVRFAVPHELVFHKIMDNVVNVIKASEQLHHRFKTGTNQYILDKPPVGPKHVPKVSVRARTLLFELEDGAFEWKLGLIHRAGKREQLQRLAREEAFRVKAKKIHEEEFRKDPGRLRNRSAMAMGRPSNTSSPWNRTRSQSEEGRPRTAMDGRSSQSSPQSRVPRYNPDAAPEINGTAQRSLEEARQTLDEYNAQSWKKRIHRFYQASQNSVKEFRSTYWGADQLPDDVEYPEKILEVPQRPALMGAVITDLHLLIDRPSFPMHQLPDFLYKVGKGMPKDTKYSLLVPMNIQLNLSEARLSLRDYPLPLIHVPVLKTGQTSRLAAMSLKIDFVIAEEFRGPESTRRIKVQITPPTIGTPEEMPGGSFAIDVRRTIGPVKTFSDMRVDVNTAYPTRITWGPSYQPAIQDMMMAIESFTKPQLDPSERVGFWDKIRLSFHSRLRVAWKEGGDVHLALKGTRDPYNVVGDGAGFLMCWRDNVRLDINADDDPKKFITVDSTEYVLAVPDFSHQVREAEHKIRDGENVSDAESYKSGAAFKKVIMKLSGKVQWMAGLVFERAIVDGRRDFNFKPHYEVAFMAPQYAKPDGALPYDAFRGFRSQHIHLSVGVRAPVDRDWTAADSPKSKSYNTIHLTPRFFTHFFAWWSLFSGPMSLPIRQGSLWPGREKNSKKFGRHLGTIKYNLLFAPLFVSHIYKHKDVEDTESSVSATGIKVRFDSFMLDMHQRREEYNTAAGDRGRQTQSRTTSMKINAAQLDLASMDVRAVSASIKGTTTEAISKNSVSTLLGEDRPSSLSNFTIPDHDTTWIDMDDFVELDWILAVDPNPDTKILPLAFAPRVTYFRQTDMGGTIDGDPDRSSPFGHEPTHTCIMSQDDDPRRVQVHLMKERMSQLDQQIEKNIRTAGEKELRMIKDDENPDLKADFENFSRNTGVLCEKRNFIDAMLRQMQTPKPPKSRPSSSGGGGVDGNKNSRIPVDSGMVNSKGADFASDFKNRFVVHNLQLKWNNLLRNIILRYSHQVSQRRGFVYYLSRPAVKFILDIVEEQAKAKSNANGRSQEEPSGNQSAKRRPTQHDLDERIRQILHDGRKFVNGDAGDNDCDNNIPNVAMEDLTSGIADEFTPQSSYHVRVIAPQIQLQSDKNKKHVVLIAAKGMELKVVEVMEKSRISDMVSGLVQHRFLVRMDSTQFFVAHQEWFSGELLALYSGNRYGAPNGTSWPPWVPMEVMHDFQSDAYGFKRVVQKTSATLRYDKYNTLRLKYNDINTEGSEQTSDDVSECRMDNLWVDFPRAMAICNSQQYYAIYVIVLDLLMYSEPLEKTRSEKLEKIILASDFSDLRGTPEMVVRLQERIRRLEDIKSHFQIHAKSLDKKGWEHRLLVERDLAACEDELFFMMKAITTSQRKYENPSPSSTTALLRWSISAKHIVWHLMRDNNQPLVELQLKNVEYDRTDNSDGSHVNLMQIGSILGLNLLHNAMYPEMMAPYDDGKAKVDAATEQMIRVYWHMRGAIAGIAVMDHFEINLLPMRVQFERDVGKQLFSYIFPQLENDEQNHNGTNGDNNVDKGSNGFGQSETPSFIKEMMNDVDGETLVDDGMSSSGRSGSRFGVAASDKDSGFSTRPGSLELRLRPTLNSEPRLSDGSPHKPKGLSVNPVEGSMFRLFGNKTANKKPSYESLRPLQTPRPGIGRSATAATSMSDAKKGSRFALRSGKGPSEEKRSDDISKMMERASEFMTFAYIKMSPVVLCVSYKGKGDRNLEDVHDFVFRLPIIEYRNKTWSNLDLAMALKQRATKALISHTGALIGNKFSKHRPNQAQQNKLREMATSSVLLATPGLGNSTDNSDDSSSLFGADYSRSPPRSLRGSHTSIPGPNRSDSRSSSVASSRRSYRPTSATNDHTPTLQTEQPLQQRSANQPPMPSFFMMTTPSTPIERPMTGMSMRAFDEAPSSGSLVRPQTSAGVVDEPQGGELRRGKTGQGEKSGSDKGGFLRGKLNAFNVLTSRRKDKDASGGGGGSGGSVNGSLGSLNTGGGWGSRSDS